MTEKNAIHSPADAQGSRALHLFVFLCDYIAFEWVRSKSPEVLGVLFAVKRFSFSFCIRQGSHPPRLARRRACDLPERKLTVFEMRCLVRDTVFVKSLSC